MRRLVLLVAAACGEPSSPHPGVPSGTGPYFAESMFFNQDIRAAPVAAESAQWIAALRDGGGWGYGDRFLVDFSFDVLRADETTPRQVFVPEDGFFYTPDCDHAPVPVPAVGNVEGEAGYECRAGGDCHLLVVDDSTRTLYEMYKASVTPAEFRGGCLAIWDLDAPYDETLRGDQCASADAAGLPIAPLLFTADEVAAGELPHAIRFTLPNDRTKKGYVRPATHGTDTDGASDAPPYGIHLRLDPNYPVETLPSEGARVVARALQEYGMYHADGGEIALTAASDRYTTAKWAGLLAEDDLQALRIEDFDVIDHGPVQTWPYRCER